MTTINDTDQECTKLRITLESFCSTIEATGGITCDGGPVADPEWTDLGDEYLSACKALGRAPLVQAADEEEEEEDE